MKTKDRCNHLKKASDCLVNYIADVSSAVLRSDIKLKPANYKKLKKFKKTFLYLAKRKPSVKEKRKKLLKQKGGFVSALIPTLIGILGSALVDKLI